jgi:hypothetical protein
LFIEYPKVAPALGKSFMYAVFPHPQGSAKSPIVLDIPQLQDGH